jgi:PucR family transcriptional regulator, purine catabolism regulatory protein
VLTVRDLLKGLDVRLLAGEAGLDVPVRWVHISELGDPTPWLKGGELLLTTGPQADDLGAYVDRLADHGLAGLGFGTGFGHDDVPAALAEAAEARGFPLFEVPYDVPFIAVTEAAGTRLVNEQYALLRRSIAAQERLQRIVLSERGLDVIAQALAALVGGPVLVFDGRGEPLASAAYRAPLDPEVVRAAGAELHERARRGADAAGRAFVPAAGLALALPVGAEGGGLPQAWLLAAKDDGGLADIDRLVLQQAVTVVALELLRRRVADTTERRLAGDVLSAVVRGDLEGAELARRLEPFALAGEVGALVVAPPPRSGAAAEAALADALRAEAVGGLVASHERFACALLPGLPEDELADVAERLVARVAAALGERPFAGLGRTVPAGRAREAFNEARLALEARELSPVNGHDPRATIATAADLGSFQLLLALQGSDALRGFCDAMLGPLEQGEGHYGGELVRSLEAFIECNGQWEAAARKLYCHRHTLRYRIRKIEELTGRDLGSARNRIEFWLALRGRELVPATTGESK